MSSIPETELDFEVIQKKQALLKKQAMLERILESDVEAIKVKALTVGRYALWIGGAFVATYVIFGLLFDDEEDESNHNKQIVILPSTTTAPHADTTSTTLPTGVSTQPYPEIVQSIMRHMGAFLLAIAKEKLLDILETMQQKQTQDDFTPEGL